MGHKSMAVLSDDARRTLNKLVSTTGMSAETLIEMALDELDMSGKVLPKARHDRLTLAVSDALGEHAGEYDAEAIARTIARNGYASYAIDGQIYYSTDWHKMPYLEIVNLSVTLDDYRIDDYRI